MRGVTGRLAVSVEPGTIVGPDNIGEYHVALSTGDGFTEFGYATPAEITLAVARAIAGDPRSVTEARDQGRLAALVRDPKDGR